MNLTPAQRLKKSRIDLLMDEPFFGSLLMQLQPVEDPSVPTFRTNGEKLWYSPDYLERQNDRQLRTVLCHEVLHPAFLHPFRLGDRDLRAANRAADYVINNFLDNYNQEAVKRGETPPFEWPADDAGKPDVLIDHQYDDMSFEEVYAELMRKPPGDEQNPQQPPGGPGQGQPGPNGPPQPGAGSGSDGQPGTEQSSPGEFSAGAADEAEAQAQEAKWKVAVKQAAVMAKGRGCLPAGLERTVNELLDPKAGWREILRNLLTSLAKDDYTWSRPNTRYAGTGMILPSLHSPRLGRIAVAIDTSGSIGQQELNEFLAEVRAILFDCRPEKLILIQCDAAIQEWTELDPFDEVDVHLKGGGGTNFRPVFERLAEEPEPPAALVYLTDLYGTAPDQAPPYPVIWACNNQQTGPFGATVHI